MASPWIWDAIAKRYRGAPGTPFSGRFINQNQMAGMRDQFIAASKADFDALAARLTNGEITLQQWQAQFRVKLKNTYIDSYFSAVGGRSRATPQDYGRVGAMLRNQYAYAQKFAEDVQAGKYSAEYVANRSRLYVESASQAFEQGRAVSAGVVLPNYPGDGTTECMTNCQCKWEIKSNGDGTANCYWRLGAAEHCGSCLARSFSWNPLVVNENPPQKKRRKR